MIIAAGIVLAVAVLATIIAMLVRRQLQEKYAVLWLAVGFGLIILSFFPGVLVGLTRLLGVELPSNLLFAIAIVLLLGVALHLSWELSRAEGEIRRLVEEHVILRLDVDHLLAAALASAATDTVGLSGQRPSEGSPGVQASDSTGVGEETGLVENTQ